MKHGEGGDALVLEAREMLAAGQGTEEVFAELAARTGDWDACALARCLALGVSRPDAEARIHEARPLFHEFEAGEEDIVTMLLARGHVFVVDRVLDGRGERIRDLLWTAACARGGFPGGMILWFRTGELTKIFLLFAQTRVRDGRGSPPEFWATMVTAGELLATEDGSGQAEVTAGLEHSRAQATSFSTGSQMRP
ncbi:hypothetical protein CP980_06930 [Streptomyces vinaceus]|uniref:Uncharacterized protein n=1 Tax=Streptomyces vinaceus TaxID=1960 RepID=A0A5J6J1H9_STRVI|nr:hypothetical protein [Streptomyces vinaceus]QEV44829.1 hypothetical protein CP980_06930 [Streptomyces vinaceus]GHE24861.1 hypothetical protein GCM10017778_00760 [Streptomyces vinaceus]